MTFLPNDDNLFVKLEPVEKVSPAPSSEHRKRTMQTGRVLAVGPGREVNGQDIDVPFEVGQLVAFGSHAGCESEIDGVQCVVLQARDVLGTFADDDGSPLKSPEPQ